MNTISPEMFHAFEQVLMKTCILASLSLFAIVFFIKVVCPAWDRLVSTFKKQGVDAIIAIPLVIGICFYGMTKGGYSGRISYDGGIKSGATANLVTNDTISIYWSKDAHYPIPVPDSAAVYIDYREIGATNVEWGLLAQSTVGAGHWEGTYPNATNYDFNVWAYYIPPEPVHTNGTWVYKSMKDRNDRYAIPIRARIEINHKAIATPKEKRKDESQED